MHEAALIVDQQLMGEAQLSKWNHALGALKMGSEPAQTYNRLSAPPAALGSGGGETPTVHPHVTIPA